MNIQTNIWAAARLLEAHSHEAILCADGLLTKTWVSVQPPKCDTWEDVKALDCDDIWFEEPMCFPISETGMVDLKAIKAWLGY